MRAGNGLSGWAVLAGGDKRRGVGGGLSVEYAVRNKERQRQTDERSGRKGDLDGLGQTGNGSTLSLARSRKAHVAKFLAVVSKAIDRGRSLCLAQLSTRCPRHCSHAAAAAASPRSHTAPRRAHIHLPCITPSHTKQACTRRGDALAEESRSPSPACRYEYPGLGGLHHESDRTPSGSTPRWGWDPRENITLSSNAR